MLGRTALLVSALVVLQGVPAFSQETPVALRIESGTLRNGLISLQRQTGIELLYDGKLVHGLQATSLTGVLTAEEALERLLSGTDLEVRRAVSGAWIIERHDTRLPELQDAVLAEILIVGRQTLNAGIRRHESDIQPYTIAYGDEIVRADRDNLDQFISSRITANTVVVPAHASQDGNTLSAIDLRGLGMADTVVLVDGRRMPSIPEVTYSDFRQADVSAIPLHAIERIEVLTGTAGGIYGFGALGGVVNVVLDRDSEGLELHTSQGISSRGDARRYGFDVKFGRAFRDGATDITLLASRTASESVRAGKRGYVMRDRRRTYELNPDLYLARYAHEDSISIRSPYRINWDTLEVEFEPDLVFKPEYGGGTLGSHQTFLPTGLTGDPGSITAELVRNAGQRDFSIPADEALVELGSSPRTDAVVASIRNRFTRGAEVFADVLVLRSRGRSHGNFADLTNGTASLEPESPANPFDNFIQVTFPVEPLIQSGSTRARTSRYTAGLFVPVANEWRGGAELSWGSFDRSAFFASEYPEYIGLSLVGDPSDLETNPFGDWETFRSSIAQERDSTTLHTSMHTRFRSQALRLGGPLFRMSEGPVTLTLLAERRTESVPSSIETRTETRSGAEAQSAVVVAPRSVRTSSYLAELRAKLLGSSSSIAPLRELEVQIAFRHDRERNVFTPMPRDPDPDFIHAAFSGASYTAGLKVAPTRWLTVRGSYATGAQPPPLGALNEQPEVMTTTSYTTDPRRGGTNLGVDGPFLHRYGGNERLSTARATTVFLGAVLTPSGVNGPRLSFDYSHIRRKRDLFRPTSEEVLLHEEAWPERVERAPMTSDDLSNGYSAGRVTLLDARMSNEASLEVEAFDIRVDVPTSLFGGRLRLSADATYHMKNAIHAPFRVEEQRAGKLNGPLKWRAVGGVVWSKGHVEFGAHLQHFGSSLVEQHGIPDSWNEINIQMQGASRIPSQSYLDLHSAWRRALRGAKWVDYIECHLGIVNVFDKAPPRESAEFNRDAAYSRYGDARQRRFELGVSLHL